MKRAIISMLVLSLLLAGLTACGAQAKQPEKPIPPVQNVQTEAVKAEEGSEATQEDQQEDNSKLYIAYRATYDCCVEYTSESLEDQLDKEVRDLKTVAAGFVSLPDDYAEDYKAWRIENCGTGFKEAEAGEAEESNGATIPEYGFTAVDETLYATGTVNLRSGPGTSYDKVGSLSIGATVHRVGIGTGTADGWSQIELSDGTLVCVSSNYLSFTKPAVQQLSSNQVNDNSGESQQVSSDGRSSFLDPNPNAGKTEEQIQQELEEAQNTEFRIHGTGGSTGGTQQPSGDWGFNPWEGKTEEEIQQAIEDSYDVEYRVYGT